MTIEVTRKGKKANFSVTKLTYVRMIQARRGKTFTMRVTDFKDSEPSGIQDLRNFFEKDLENIL